LEWESEENEDTDEIPMGQKAALAAKMARSPAIVMMATQKILLLS
jgi:hypothetical protein